MHDVVLYPRLEIIQTKPLGVLLRIALYDADGKRVARGPRIAVQVGCEMRLHPLSYALTPSSMLTSMHAPELALDTELPITDPVVGFTETPEWVRKLIPPYTGE